MLDKDSSRAVAGAAGIALLTKELSDHEREVITALRDVIYGEIEVIVHNAKIVQITRSEKRRFDFR